MISSLRGEVAQIGLESLVLDVHGIGYRIFATPATLGSVRHGSTATLATTLVVREDSLTLFGFQSADERDMYETLQTVSGVGPKLALAMLAVYTPDELRRAVESEDFKTLQQIPGVGPKSAKRLVLELHGKLGAATDKADPGPASSSPAREDVLNALVGLGWNLKAAEKAVDAVISEGDGAPGDAAALLRAALVVLGGKQRG